MKINVTLLVCNSVFYPSPPPPPLDALCLQNGGKQSPPSAMLHQLS